MAWPRPVIAPGGLAGHRAGALGQDDFIDTVGPTRGRSGTPMARLDAPAASATRALRG